MAEERLCQLAGDPRDDGTPLWDIRGGGTLAWDPGDGRIPSQITGLLGFQNPEMGSLHHTVPPLPPSPSSFFNSISKQVKMRKEEEKKIPEPGFFFLNVSSLRARWSEGNAP